MFANLPIGSILLADILFTDVGHRCDDSGVGTDLEFSKGTQIYDNLRLYSAQLVQLTDVVAEHL